MATVNFTEQLGKDGGFACSAWEEDGRFFFADENDVVETPFLVDANEVKFDEYQGWLYRGALIPEV